MNMSISNTVTSMATPGLQARRAVCATALATIGGAALYAIARHYEIPLSETYKPTVIGAGIGAVVAAVASYFRRA